MRRSSRSAEALAAAACFAALAGSCWAGEQYTGGTAGPVPGEPAGALDGASADARAADASGRRYPGPGGLDAFWSADQTPPDASPAEGSGGAAGAAGAAASAGAPPTCPNGTCDPPESCETCPADCGPCCPNGACDHGESCETCSADCGPCCPNGACDHGESCETCSADCGACWCGNGKCNPGETCQSCWKDCGCGECYARCCNDALYGTGQPDGGACVAWGQQVCGGNVLLRSMFNGQYVYEKPNKCWVMCGNYTVYHLLDYVTQGCHDEGVKHCASHGGFKDVKWQPCQP
jgi:hypothetical protein